MLTKDFEERGILADANAVNERREMTSDDVRRRLSPDLIGS
jgi:hypothetical protein